MFSELSAKGWFEEIDKALEYRRNYGREGSWNESEKLFYNGHESQAKEGPNLIYSVGDALLSAMSVPTPYVTIKARRQESIMKARIIESLDNTLIDTMNMTEECEVGVLSAFLYGRAIFKIGYDSEYGWNRKLDINGVGASLSQFDRKSNRIEFGNIRPGMPWLQCVMPHDFLVPWGTGPDLKKASWCAHRIVRHIDDIKADPKYKNTSSLQPVMSQADFVRSYESPRRTYRSGTTITRFDPSGPYLGTEEAEYCELWEIHDRRTGKVKVVATGHDKFLRNEPDDLQVEGLPFVSFSFVPAARTFWVTSDADYLLQSQAELSDIALQRGKIRRLAVLKFLYDTDRIEEDAMEKLTSAEVGAGVPVQGDGQPLTNAVSFVQPPGAFTLAPEAEDVRRNARELAGFSRNQLGEFESNGRRTATEVAEVSASHGLRLNRRQAKIAKFYTDAFKIINGIVMTQWQSPRVTEVLGPEGEMIWQTFNGPGLRGDYAYQIGFSIEANETRAMRKQAALQAYMLAMQDPRIDPQAATQYIIQAYNDPEFAQIFKKQDQQQMGAGAIGAGNVRGQVANGGTQQGPQPAQGTGGQNPIAGLLEG